jgi:hypothetical protein
MSRTRPAMEAGAGRGRGRPRRPARRASGAGGAGSSVAVAGMKSAPDMIRDRVREPEIYRQLCRAENRASVRVEPKPSRKALAREMGFWAARIK